MIFKRPRKFFLLSLALFAALPLTLLSHAEPQRSRPVVAEDPARPKIDVESYTVDVTVDPKDRSLKGSAEIQFKQTDQNSYAAFDLDRRLRVSSVTLGGERGRYRQFDNTSTVELDLSDQRRGDWITVRIDYAGILEPEDPELLREPSPGRSREPARRDQDLLRIDGDSALLLYEGKWFPTNGLYTDKAHMVLRARALNGWSVVSDLPASGPGEYRSPTRSYWGALALGDFRVAEVRTKRGSVTCHILKSDIAYARAIAASAAHMQDFYEETFGSSLSASVHIVEAEGVDWGIRSSAGLFAMGSSKFRRDFDEPALGRALARQWFPTLVTVKDREADAWLAEGMPILATLLYQEKVLSPVEFDAQVDKVLVKALGYEGRMTTRAAGSLGQDTPEYHALVEYRGAYILRMLRWVLGDDKFKELTGRYLKDFLDTPVSTEAFARLASDVGGEDLKYFFDQWLNSWGAPTFEAEYTVFRTKSGYVIRGTVRQDLELFRMPVEIEIETETESEFQRVELAGPSSDFDAMSVRKPRGIRVDPQRKILRSSPDIKIAVLLNRGEEYANDERYEEAITQYQRALDLNSKHSLASFRMGEVLFQMGNLQAALQGFRDALAGNLQPRWVEVWAHINLGKIYDLRGIRERALSEYQQAVNVGDDSYGAQAEAKQYLSSPFRGSAKAVEN